MLHDKVHSKMNFQKKST